MSGEVKVFRVRGKMLISHDRFPEWRKFEILVRALKEEHAIEKVYSDLGSRHKLRRKHIKIESIDEVPVEEIEDLYIVKLSRLEKFVKTR